MVLRCEQQAVTAAKAEADDADRSDLERGAQMLGAGLHVVHHAIIELGGARHCALGIGRRRLARVGVPHHRGKARLREQSRPILHEAVDRRNRRQDQHAAARPLGVRDEAVQPAGIDAFGADHGACLHFIDGVGRKGSTKRDGRDRPGHDACVDWMMIALFLSQFDAGRLHDRPPFLDLGRMMRQQRLR